FGELEGDAQQLFFAAAEQRERTVRGNLVQRFLVLEVIAELRGRFLLFGRDTRYEDGVIGEVASKRAEQLRVFGELLDENGTRTVERGLHIRHAGILAVLRREGLF